MLVLDDSFEYGKLSRCSHSTRLFAHQERRVDVRDTLLQTLPPESSVTLDSLARKQFLMSHFARLSASQSLWLVGTLIWMLAMIGVGWYLEPKGDEIAVPSFSADQSIRQIAPEIGTTGFAMAKELHLSRKVNMDTAGNREQTTGASVLRGIRRTLDVNQRVWRIRGCAKGPALA